MLTTILLSILGTTSALSITKFESAVSRTGGGIPQGQCVNQVTFDDSEAIATVSGCVGLSDQTGDRGVRLHCDGNNPGKCPPGRNSNECGCGMWVNYAGQHVFVTYDENTQVCNLPGSTPGDIGNCVQREGTGYPILMLAD